MELCHATENLIANRQGKLNAHFNLMDSCQYIIFMGHEHVHFTKVWSWLAELPLKSNECKTHHLDMIMLLLTKTFTMYEIAN